MVNKIKYKQSQGGPRLMHVQYGENKNISFEFKDLKSVLFNVWILISELRQIIKENIVNKKL